MSALLKWCNAAYWLALTIWVAALLSAGVAAGGVFATLPRLGLLIERFRPALGDNPVEHGRLAGGMVMEPIFTMTDIAQIGAACIVVFTLMVQFVVFHLPWKSFANLLRAVCIAVAVALVVHHTFAMGPRMNRELRSFWQAAEQNDQVRMTAHRQAFDADHVLANRLFMFRLGILLLAVLASGAAFTQPRSITRARQM
jgi:hypothetical protein